MLNTSNQFEHSGGNKFFCTESGKLANGCRDLVASESTFVSPLYCSFSIVQVALVNRTRARWNRPWRGWLAIGSRRIYRQGQRFHFLGRTSTKALIEEEEHEISKFNKFPTQHCVNVLVIDLSMCSSCIKVPILTCAEYLRPRTIVSV